MTNISTSLPTTSASVKETTKHVQGPSRLTLERIRQVARAYTALSISVPAGSLILN
ncbi:MAG: hypothetical protein NC339_02895 [Muribaculaceae bacterium]|nr:hypothetical protein [Muribaculaceae bacterium]